MQCASVQLRYDIELLRNLPLHKPEAIVVHLHPELAFDTMQLQFRFQIFLMQDDEFHFVSTVNFHCQECLRQLFKGVVEFSSRFQKFIVLHNFYDLSFPMKSQSGMV